MKRYRYFTSYLSIMIDKKTTSLWKREVKDYKILLSITGNDLLDLDEITYPFMCWKNHLDNFDYLINKAPDGTSIKNNFIQKRDHISLRFKVRYEFFYKNGNVINIPPLWIHKIYKSI